MTDIERKILRHSLGLDGKTKRSYRNRFCAGPGTDSYPHCEALVSAGFMDKRPSDNPSSGLSIYYVTAAGQDALVKEPKLPPH